MSFFQASVLLECAERAERVWPLLGPNRNASLHSLALSCHRLGLPRTVYVALMVSEHLSAFVVERVVTVIKFPCRYLLAERVFFCSLRA